MVENSPGGSGQSRRTHPACLGAQYRRLARRIGANRAALAVAHSIAVISHRIIDRGEDYVDLGYHYFEQRDRDAITRRAVRQLERLGHNVTLQAA